MKQKIISFFHKKEFYTALIATFAFGLITHGFIMTNYMFCHDSLIFSFSEDLEWKMTLGRFMQPLSALIRGNIHVPWLIGIISMIYVSITTYLVTKIFALKNKIHIVGISGILVTNVILTITNASYMHETDSFMLSLLLSVLSVYIFDKSKFSFLLSSLLLMMSMGFYQAYIQVALALFTIIIIMKLLNNIELKEILKYCLKLIVTILLAGIMYYIVYKLMLSIFSLTEIVSYNTVSQLYSIFDLGIIRDIYYSLYNSYHVYINGPTVNSTITTLLHISSIIIILVVLIKRIKEEKLKIKHIMLILIFLICLCLTLNIVTVLANGMFQYLMIYSICIPLILLIILLNKESNKVIKKIGISIVFIIIFFNILYANQVYLKKELDYQSTQELYSRIISDIEEVEGYIPNVTEVIFVGNLDFNDNYEYNDIFYHLDETSLNNKYSITYKENYLYYNEFIINSPLNVVIDNSYNKNKEVAEMSIYPYSNSIKIVDNKIIVKLSDKEYNE